MGPRHRNKCHKVVINAILLNPQSAIYVLTGETFMRFYRHHEVLFTVVMINPGLEYISSEMLENVRKD